MKLAVTDIRISAFNTLCATIDVEVEHGKSIYSACTMDVSVPLVDGKAIKDHEEDLKSKAREIITGMYKEIVCVGETNEASGLLDYLSAKTEPSELGKELLEQIKSTRSNNELEERVATLEKRLSGKRTMHVSERAVEFYNPDGTLAMRFGDLNQQEKRLGGERSMRITSEHGQLLVHGERVSAPTYDHRNVIINKAIDELKSGHTNMLKRLGRCMGLLQVAAEIEAANQLCGSARRENVLKDFDNPPFKNVPDDWISPGLAYLDRRV